MNKFSISTILLLSLFTLLSCSNDEPTGVDTSILDGISRSEINMKFDIVKWDEYENYNDGEGWIESDFDNLIGLEMPAPASIIFQSGMILYKEDFFTDNYASDPVLLILEAYKKSAKKAFDVYISTPLNYDETTGELNIGGTDYIVKTLTNSKLIMEQYGYGWQVTINGEIPFDALSVLEYKAVEFTPIDLDANLICSSLENMQRKIIALCREHFGNTIDLTEVYGGSVVLDAGNIIDLDELERELGL